MDQGFALGSQVLVERDRVLPIQILRTGDNIVCFVGGRLFPAMVALCYQHFVNRLQVIKTDEGNLRCGINQSIYQYGGYTELHTLLPSDILLKQNQEPVRIKESALCEISMPVYVLQTYPELPFVVNGFVVGSPGVEGKYYG